MATSKVNPNLGKELFIACAITRGLTPDRAELDWKNWEEGKGYFLTKQEWQKAAVMFLIGTGKIENGDLQS